MSGPLGSSQWMYSSGSGFYPYEIGQSLRFNDNDSAYLATTVSTASSTYTLSLWLKRGVIASSDYQYIFSSGVAGLAIGSTAGNTDKFYTFNGATITATPSVYRDPSAWYHLLLSVASNTGTLYVNGESVLTGAPCASLSTTANATRLGHYGGGGAFYFDGYMAEVNFIDGLALDPMSFGEFKSGVWIPKKYTGSYGTNGFYLSFADSAAIGDDLSGNGNDWTANNLVSTDVLLDSPTENYATLNPLDSFASGLSEGNLKFANGAGAGYKGISTFVIDDIADTQKYYVEYVSDVGYLTGIVTTANSGPNSNTNYTDIRAYYSNGNKYAGTTATAYGASFTASDQLAMLVGDGQIEFFKNNVSQGVAFSGLTGSWKVATVAFGPAGQGVVFNFGQAPFAYAVPTGATTLNTANLPDPVIDPAQDDVPADYFNTVLYTGDGAYPRSISGVGFQPDFVWAKTRNQVYGHVLYDVVRGVGSSKSLYTASTDSEGTFSDNSNLTSFDADGFTLGSTVSADVLNNASNTRVAWNWKANGAGVSNTDGTITSTVSANQKAGFSIVSYSYASAGSVGHGLGSTPAMIVSKARTAATSGYEQWFVYHKSLGASQHIIFNNTNAAAPATPGWGTVDADTFDATASFFQASNDYIAYCFAEVEGYSKFGSYTGNGSADGPFVWCGFRPAFVVVKRTDSTGSWLMVDVKRSPINVIQDYIFSESSGAENGAGPGGTIIDTLSNGFKFRSGGGNTNASGGTYIFMAFAEAPFKYANAR